MQSSNDRLHNGDTITVLNRSKMTKRKPPKAKDNGQQTTLKGFGFCQPVAKKDSDKTGKENEAENNMGLSSNLRTSAIQRCKKAAYSKKRTQKKLNGTDAASEARCDEGTKVCKACEYNKKQEASGSSKKARFSHDPTCVINTNYKITNGGRISMSQYYLEKYEEERAKELKRPFSGKELHSGGNRQEDVDEFFLPPSDFDNGDKPPSDVQSEIYYAYETDKLVNRITHYAFSPSSYMKKNKSKSVPLATAAAIQSLLDIIPTRYKDGTNELQGINNAKSNTYKRMQAYCKHFPPGTIGFTFPRADKSKPPDYQYNQLEGKTIYFVNWEINIPGWQPTCFECGETMVHDKYDFQSYGYASPIFDISGRTDYAVSAIYQCACGNRCKASDGRILIQVPIQYRRAFPVDPRYAVKQERYLSESFSRVMDKMFITHGNGDQLAIMLNELRGDNYLDIEEEYYKQAIDSGVQIRKRLPTFETFIGRYSHSGEQLRDAKDAAAISELLSTGVSDKSRVRREMQSVGSQKTSASDHTYEFKKNYMNGLLPKNACGHTMGTDTGEIASIAIVKNESQKEYAHQAEQCTLRANWRPKVHSTDTCPNGVELWKRLIRGVHNQLGLFHFQQRITKTLNKECDDWRLLWRSSRSLYIASKELMSKE